MPAIQYAAQRRLPDALSIDGVDFRQHALRQAVADFGVSFRGGKELIEQRLDLGVAKRFKSLWAISHGI
jgi:hypothetical protein